jgi:hypothetical protein
MDAKQVAAQLRDIAGTLETGIEQGHFDLCFAHVRADMATLPDRLAELADDLDPPAKP